MVIEGFGVLTYDRGSDVLLDGNGSNYRRALLLIDPVGAKSAKKLAVPTKRGTTAPRAGPLGVRRTQPGSDLGADVRQLSAYITRQPSELLPHPDGEPKRAGVPHTNWAQRSSPDRIPTSRGHNLGTIGQGVT